MDATDILVPHVSALTGFGHRRCSTSIVWEERGRGQYRFLDGRLAFTQCPNTDHKHGLKVALAILAYISFQDRGQWQSDQYSSCCFVDLQSGHSGSVPLGNQGQPWWEISGLRSFILPISNHRIQSHWEEGSIWALGGNGRHRLLADFVLTTRLGLHVVYT